MRSAHCEAIAKQLKYRNLLKLHFDVRQVGLNGSRCFNDSQVISAFSAIADLRPFLPNNQESVSYYESQQLFIQGKVGMWMGASWDISFLKLAVDNAVDNFNWSVFAVPSSEGKPAYVSPRENGRQSWSAFADRPNCEG